MVQYFQNFGKIEYPLNEKSVIQVTNILSRVVFSTGAQNILDLVNEYQIQEGDSPDIVANKVYGDPSLWWVILMFNDVLNPYWDWSLGIHCSESHIKKNYPGSALFIHKLSDDKTPQTDINIRINDTIAVYNDANGTSFGGVKGLVYDYDMNLQRILVQGITGGSFSDGSIGRVVGMTAGSEYSFTIANVVDSAYNGLHHFEGLSGEVLNPFSQYVSGSTIYPVGAAGASVEGHDAVSYDNCLLQNYVTNTDSTRAVTIWQNKLNELEDNRSIKILNRDYIPKVLEVMEKVMNE